MQKETAALVDDVMFGHDADLREFLDTRSAFLNDELAKLYGLPPVGVAVGKDLVKTALGDDSPRTGFLTQGSFLALNAHATTTSPTRRGKFVREALLCQAIPAPPADVNPTFPADPAGTKRTMREKLEQHRKDPSCAGCHQLTDPIGLAFENFDAIGAYRTMDAGKPIDASGELDGMRFTDARQLSRNLRNLPGTGQCLARNLFRYATGHVETDGEEPALAAVLGTYEKSGDHLRPLVQALVASPAFLYAEARR
jgi:hypothetical protein